LRRGPAWKAGPADPGINGGGFVDRRRLMKSHLIRGVLVIFITVAALAVRLPGLGLRPMHHDEANQVVKCGVLQETGVYKYDSTDHHGPTLYYLTLPFAWAASGRDFAGTSEATYRVVPVLFGTAAILLFFLLHDGLGGTAAAVSAGLMALSPAMVYYSRFYIQEMLLVFFTLGAIASGWRYFKARTATWAAVTGLFLGLMFSTKETSVIAYASMAGAIAVVFAWERGNRENRPDAYSSTRGMPTGVFNSGHLLVLLAVAAAVSVIFFTSFFTNLRGPIDSILAYKTYAGKSAESAHVHPWYYYLQVLAYWKTAPGPFWSEGLILALSLAGLICVLAGRTVDGGDRTFLRFVLGYTVLMTVIYSVIPYKTPWCLLSFLTGLIMLAGFGTVSIMGLLGNRLLQGVFAILIVLATWNLGRQAWVGSTRFGADPRNPYVYAHTVPDFLNLVKRIDVLGKIHPDGRRMLIAVVAGPHEMWPLPWYLRAYPEKGFWQDSKELPETMRPVVAVVSADQQEAVLARLGGNYHAEFYGLRPGVLMSSSPI